MAYCMNPEIQHLMEQCCVDKLKRIKLLPFFLPSQAKFFQKECNAVTESDLLEYFRQVEVRITRAYWPTTFAAKEVVVNSPVFHYMCDSITEEGVYYRLMEQLYHSSKTRTRNIALILLVTDSLVKNNKESIVAILHNLSMLIVNELMKNDVSDPLPRLLVTENVEASDPFYAEGLQKLWKVALESNGDIDALTDYIAYSNVFVTRCPFGNIDGVVQRSFQLPSNFEKALRSINSAQTFRQVLDGIYQFGHFSYHDVLKMCYMTYNLSVWIPEVGPQIIFQFAKFIKHSLI